MLHRRQASPSPSSSNRIVAINEAKYSSRRDGREIYVIDCSRRWNAAAAFACYLAAFHVECPDW
jgi:hypothetical protein